MPGLNHFTMRRRNQKRRSIPHNSDVWLFPGMDRSRGGDDWYGRYYDGSYRYNGEYPYVPEAYRRQRGHEGRDYRDTDIYEQEIGSREYRDPRYDHYQNEPWHNDHDRHRGFFERAGDRIREIWDEWNGRPHDNGRDGYFAGPFDEDHNEHRYGRDNWAPNSNRGYSGRRPQRSRHQSAHHNHY
jgi:hypothetical protein